MRRYLLLLLLSACTQGPDFTPPEPLAVHGYLPEGETAPAEIKSGETISTAWWQEFKSPPLNNLIETALKQNPDMEAAQARLNQAEELTNAEQGTLLPQLSLNASAARQKYGVALFGSQATAIPPFTAYQVGPGASWGLDLFGAGRRSVEERQAQADYQAELLASARLTLAGNIMQQALALASANAEMDATQEIIAEGKRSLVLTQERFKAGAGTKVEILTAQSQLDNDRTLLAPLRQQVSVARHALSVLSGNLPENTPPDFTLSSFTLPASLPISLPSELAHHRPDILAAEANLHAASAAVGVATAHLYPDINLTATGAQEALTPAGIFESNASAWSIAAGLTAPIFSGGKLTAEKHAAEEAYQAALADYRAVLLRAFGEVADTLTALSHDAQEVKQRSRAVKTAESSLDLARRSYKAGNTGILQILEAERQLSQARIGFAHAKAQRYQDTAKFFVVLGGASISEKP